MAPRRFTSHSSGAPYSGPVALRESIHRVLQNFDTGKAAGRFGCPMRAKAGSLFSCVFFPGAGKGNTLKSCPRSTLWLFKIWKTFWTTVRQPRKTKHIYLYTYIYIYMYCTNIGACQNKGTPQRWQLPFSACLRQHGHPSPRQNTSHANG